MSKPTVAFIGAGNMGRPMIAQLAAAGYRVRAGDVSAAALAAVRGPRVETIAAPADAVRGAAYVLLSLPSPEAVCEVLTAALPAIEPGATVVDLSTIDPGTSRAMAAACAERSIGFVEAPVSGGVQAASTGNLTILIGGEPAAVERAQPLLSVLGGTLVTVGGVGDAQTAKLCNNMLAAVHTAALGEVLVTGVKAGLDFDTLFRVLASSTGSSHVLTHYLPVTIMTEERPSRFALDLMLKDIGLYLRAAGEAGCPTPIGGTIRGLYEIARCTGLGQADATSVIEYYEELAGVRLAPAVPASEQAA